jgi:thiamine-phosphate pyrophosphorylase
VIEGTILPKTILIGERFTDRKVQLQILDTVKGGIRWVHLRDNEADEFTFEATAIGLVDRIRSTSPDMLVSVNTRLSVAQKLGLHFHTGTRGPSIARAREALGPAAVVGFSAHDRVEGEDALRSGADYLFFSPVFETASKPGAAGAGLETLRHFCRNFEDKLPVFALGGISPDRVRDCLEAGAFGVAVLSGILHADDSADAASTYMQEIETAVNSNGR